MIKVHIDRNYYGIQIIVSGHANYAEKGHDIICAGVSVLSDTLCNMANGIESECVVIQPMEGFTHVFIKGPESERTAGILDTIITGYQMIAEAYPDYVQIEYKE